MNRTVVVDPKATPPLLIPGCDKGGTSDAFNTVLRDRAHWASRYSHACDKKGAYQPGDMRGRDKCIQKSKELGCMYRGGNAESWARCYKGYVPDGGKLWIDATPNYLWGWKPGTDVATRVRELSPTTTVVLLLREPVSRLRSLFNYWTDKLIGKEIGSRLETHVVLDLEYLSAPVAYRDFKAKTEETLSLDMLYGDEGRAVFEKYLRYYEWWVGQERPRERCREIVGDVGAKKNSPWRSFDHTAETTPKKRPPCPLFVNFVLTSLYYPLVQHWMKLFPERILVLQSEYYFADRRLLSSIFGHGNHPVLDGPPHRNDNANRLQVTNQGHYDTDNATLTEATRDALHAFYATSNDKLRGLLRTEAEKGTVLVAPSPDVPGSWWVDFPPGPQRRTQRASYVRA